MVTEPGSEDRIWWGDVNHPLPEEKFDGLRAKVVAHLDVQDPLYVVDAFAGADPAHRISVRVLTGNPYHALFAKTMFIDPSEDELETFEPQALVLHAPEVEAVPEEDGTRTGTFVVLHPTRTELLVGGTYYAARCSKPPQEAMQRLRMPYPSASLRQVGVHEVRPLLLVDELDGVVGVSGW